MIEFIFKTDFKLSDEFLTSKWLEIIAKQYNSETKEITYTFCSEEEILGINQKYLNHDYFTDIITFDNSVEKISLMADIFISVETVKTNAEKFNQTFERELLRVMAHGVLHLVGFKDKEEKEQFLMRKEEEKSIEFYNKLKLLKVAVECSLRAGLKTLEFYQKEFEIETKADNSYVTEADKAANEIIIEALSSTKIPIISEETAITEYSERKTWKQNWIIDPIDGTAQFVKGKPDYTINTALIEDNIPVIGVIYAPAHNEFYFAMKGFGTYKVENLTQFFSFEELLKKSINLEFKKRKQIVKVITSRNDAIDDNLYISSLNEKFKTEGINRSSSYKFCMVAENSHQIYPRKNHLHEWDIAAGHALVKYAGGFVKNPETKKEVEYNSESLKTPSFVASVLKEEEDFILGNCQ